MHLLNRYFARIKSYLQILTDNRYAVNSIGRFSPNEMMTNFAISRGTGRLCCRAIHLRITVQPTYQAAAKPERGEAGHEGNGAMVSQAAVCDRKPRCMLLSVCVPSFHGAS